MPLRTVLGLEHIEAIVVPGGTVRARVIEMEGYDAAWWDEHVQRYIDDLPFERADQGWIWPRIFANVTLLADLILQQPLGYVVEAFDDATAMFRPAVMLMLVGAYPYLLQHELGSVFVWYLSPAPRGYFIGKLRWGNSKIPDSKELMRVGMDVAITDSYNRRLNGRLGLHAAPKGGDRLLNFYRSEDDGGMTQLPATSPLPAGMRSVMDRVKLIIRGNLRARNDGRYFYHDERTAGSASRRMDHCRSSGA